MRQFAKLFANNARPLQKLNSRTLVESLLLAAMQIIIDCACDMVFVLAASRAAGWLAERPLWSALQRWILGGVFAGIAVKLALDTRK